MSVVTGGMTKYVASKKTEGMLSPLLEADEHGDVYSVTEDETTIYSDTKDQSRQSGLERLKTAFVYLVLMAGAGASVAAFVFAPYTLVYISGGICIGNTPFSAYKEFLISTIPTLRSLNNKLRELANKLEDEVQNLVIEIDSIKPEAERTNAVEEELRTAAHDQKVNVDKVVDLVKENQMILNQMKDNLRQRVVQDIIKIVMKSDKNNDGRFDKVEAKMLALQIRIQLVEYGIDFNEQKFFHVLSVRPTVARVIGIVQKLLIADTFGTMDDARSSSFFDEDEGIDENDYDMFYMTDSIAALTGSLVGMHSSFGGERESLSLSLASSLNASGRRRSSLFFH